MNISNYTEFKDIKIGAYFIDAEGFWYEKISENGARHFDTRYINGFTDYKFSTDDRLRVQSQSSPHNEDEHSDVSK